MAVGVRSRGARGKRPGKRREVPGQGSNTERWWDREMENDGEMENERAPHTGMAAAGGGAHGSRDVEAEGGRILGRGRRKGAGSMDGKDKTHLRLTRATNARQVKNAGKGGDSQGQDGHARAGVHVPGRRRTTAGVHEREHKGELRWRHLGF